MAAFEESAAAPPASAQDFYTWTFPGAPVRIHLHLSVVESLGHEVRRAFESVPSHSVEIGGILYGIADFTASPTIEIKDFEPFLCEYRADHKFILSDGDRRKLDRLLGARRADGPEALSVVGFYRAHLGEGLSLHAEDLAVAQGHFMDPANVFLLVKPLADGSASAGFFFWDRGRIDGDFTYLEFPFDAKQLTGLRGKPNLQAELDPLPAIASQHALAPSPETPDWDPPQEIAPAPWEAMQPERSAPKQGMSPWGVVLLLLLMVLAAALGYESYLMWMSRGAAAPPPVASDSSGLALQVERKGTDLRVSWNRTAPTIAQATDGILSIHDGESQQQELHLDAEQLHSGSVIYTPANPAVKFRLEVRSPGNSKTSETVLALSAARPAAPDSTQPGSGPSPLPDAAATSSPSPGKNPAEPAAPAATSPTPTPAAEPPQTKPAAGDSSAIYLPPRPLRPVQPDLPRAVRRLIATPVEVPVKVWISPKGTVTKAEPVPTGQLVSTSLTAAAQRAAMKWRFAPAVHGTETVPSEMILKFQFHPVGR